MVATDRRSYDTGASGEVQANVNRIAGRLETLINQRASDAGIALGDFEAGDVSADYSGKERKWGDAASQTMEIVRLLRKTMEDNDQTAGNTMSRARSAVANIA
ncbi:MAG: hypothetical protein GEV10_25315 [Streptosporangiales bacterium]|nr:hypothetical protein [Streptosporangiales bacterium]